MLKKDGIKRARNREKGEANLFLKRDRCHILNKKGIENVETSHSRLESKHDRERGEKENNEGLETGRERGGG